MPAHVQGGVDAEASAQKIFVAIALGHMFAHGFDEVGGGHIGHGAGVGDQHERLAGSGLGLGCGDEPQLPHLVEHVVLAAVGAVKIAQGGDVARRLGERRQHGSLGHSQFGYALAEVGRGG